LGVGEGVMGPQVIGNIAIRYDSRYESTLGADDQSVPYFPICQGILPWQPNNVGRNEKVMNAD